MRAKFAIRFDGRFIIIEDYESAKRMQQQNPNSCIVNVWEVSDVSGVPLRDILGRLGGSWYVLRDHA